MLNQKRAIAFSLSFMLLATVAVDAFGRTDPYLKSTRTQLQKARARLYAGENDRAGHRARAMAYTTSAIDEVTAAMKSNHHAAMPGNEDSSSAVVASSQVARALEFLKQAQTNLAAATPDQGGHHAKATDLIKKAIEEVEQAIALNKAS